MWEWLQLQPRSTALIPANLFTFGMFQTGVFSAFQDLRSFVAAVPTCWEEKKKRAACIAALTCYYFKELVTRYENEISKRGSFHGI